MADDASGGDRDEDDGQWHTSSDPDGRNADGTARPAGDDRDGTVRDDSREERPVRDERREATDRPGRGDRVEDEYRIPIDLSGGPDEGRADDESDESDTDEDDPYAPEPSSAPVEPGEPELENVVFVILGAVAMVLVVLRVVSIPL